MISLSDFKAISSSLHEIITLPMLKIRQHKFNRLKEQYPEQMDYLMSMMLELPKVNIPIPLYNQFDTFDFKEEFGIVFFNILYERKFDNEYFTFPYEVQKLLRLLLSKHLISKLTENFILMSINHYYKLGELISEVELPDVVYKSDIGLQGLKKERIRYTVFPLYVYLLTKRQKVKGIRYMLKKDGKVISNIKSGVVREKLLKDNKDTDFGIIGLQTSLKGYQRKYDFTPLYYSKDPDNVKLMYQNKETKYHNEIELTKLETKKDLIKYIKKLKHKKKMVVLSRNGVEFFDVDIRYVNAPVVDYLYNEYYDIVGLVVKYQDEYYNIKFNISETHYIDGIENKFLKVAVTYFHDLLVNVQFAGVIKKWDRYYDKCVICGLADSKHYRDGICYSCKYKLDKYSERVGRLGKFKCNKDFDMLTDDLIFYANGNEVEVIKKNKVYQQSLPFDEVDFCNYMKREEKKFKK
jgi:hypothetical protein